MTPREEGFLLLTSFLGDPARKPLSTARFRELTKKVRLMEKPTRDAELTEQDLKQIGCSAEESCKILHLLSQTEQLSWYVNRGREDGCYPITRVSPGYPPQLRKNLSLEAPGVLWAKGDVALLSKPRIALVGSRDLQEENREFAQEVGLQAAKQGYALVSGDARGADRVAQEACLASGGQVIAVVSDALKDHKEKNGVLYLCPDGFDMPFTSYRALQRNWIIHALAEKTFVAQCTLKKGGTWDGSSRNLQNCWSELFCFNDNSPASRELSDMGAVLVSKSDLQDISALQFSVKSFL